MKEKNFKRILITRTDRIGDVLLSTPAIKALRRNFPQSFIAMIVRPYTRDIVLGNPYLDEVIIYDKAGAQKSLWRTIQFALRLRRQRFNLALILHPTNRMHLVAFLAGIKKRVGFNRKLGFLLTDKITHKKQEGKKHEREYTLELVRYLGITAEDQDLFMPLRKDSQDYIEQFLANQGVAAQEKMIAFHPAASCPSKMWPVERFAQTAEQLFNEFKLKPVIIAGPDGLQAGNKLAGLLHCDFVNAVGKTTVSQLASLLKRCCLLISTDSGPVHIASALGVPVAAIFGRKQAGLSPRRWAATGKNSAVLHKDAGCAVCLAHNCQNHFSCLAAVSVQEVLEAARKLLSEI